MSSSIAVSEPYFSLFSKGDVIFFRNENIDTSVDPHPHVILLKDDEHKFLLTMCTSQVEKRMYIFEKFKKNFATLVVVDPDKTNGLRKRSAIDCNAYTQFHENKLIELQKSKQLWYWGRLSDSYLLQIVNGLLESDEIEEDIKDLVRLHFNIT